MRLERDDGAAAVEFALIAPLLFILLFGIIVFGMGFYTQQGAAAAAREAARRAAVGAITTCGPYSPPTDPSQPPDLTNFENVIENAAPGAYGTTIVWDNDPNHQPTLSVSPPDALGNQTVTVEVPYHVDLGLVTALVPFSANVLDLSTSASAFVEQQQSASVSQCP